MGDVFSVIVVGVILLLFKALSKKPNKQSEDISSNNPKTEPSHPKKGGRISSPSFSPPKDFYSVTKTESPVYQIKRKKKVPSLSKVLANKNSLKQAFILSEILKRKF